MYNFTYYVSLANHEIQIKGCWLKTEFQIEVLTLIQNIAENRTRHARGPVKNISSVTYIVCTIDLLRLTWVS